MGATAVEQGQAQVNDACEAYVIDTVNGWVFVPEGTELRGCCTRRLTLALLTLGCRLCDPWEVDPEHVEGGIRFFLALD